MNTETLKRLMAERSLTQTALGLALEESLGVAVPQTTVSHLVRFGGTQALIEEVAKILAVPADAITASSSAAGAGEVGDDVHLGIRMERARLANELAVSAEDEAAKTRIASADARLADLVKPNPPRWWQFGPNERRYVEFTSVHALAADLMKSWRSESLHRLPNFASGVVEDILSRVFVGELRCPKWLLNQLAAHAHRFGVNAPSPHAFVNIYNQLANSTSPHDEVLEKVIPHQLASRTAIVVAPKFLDAEGQRRMSLFEQIMAESLCEDWPNRGHAAREETSYVVVFDETRPANLTAFFQSLLDSMGYVLARSSSRERASPPTSAVTTAGAKLVSLLEERRLVIVFSEPVDCIFSIVAIDVVSEFDTLFRQHKWGDSPRPNSDGKLFIWDIEPNRDPAIRKDQVTELGAATRDKWFKTFYLPVIRNRSESLAKADAARVQDVLKVFGLLLPASAQPKKER